MIGAELVQGRIPDARLAAETGWTPAILFAVTLVLTLTVPLRWATAVGAVLSLLAFVGASGSSGELKVATRDDGGWLLEDDIPPAFPTDDPLLLTYGGPNFFADATTLSDQLPTPDAERTGVLVFDVGELQHFSSTTLKQLEKYHARLAEWASGLVLAGIGEASRDTLERTGLLDQIGEQNIFASEPDLGASMDLGLARGRELLSELRSSRPTDASTGSGWQVPVRFSHPTHPSSGVHHVRAEEPGA